MSYKGFRLSKITHPQYNHLLYLLGWVLYFALYFLTENIIPPEKCTPVHIWLDDIVPFCEVFVIPYVFWYGLIVFSLWYFALYNVQSFKKLQVFIMITQGVAMLIYICFPNRQDLRPDVFLRDNVFTDMVGFLYSFDTNTGVFPSLHVAYSLGIASVWLKEKGVSPWWKTFVVVAVVLICLSTAFIKQHSVADALGAIPVCILAEFICYRKYWAAKWKKPQTV